jgi:anti-anti-sigma factor
MGSQLEVSIRARQGASVLAISGELDLASFAELEQAIDGIRESVPELVVLDLERLEFMDIAGLRAVLGADERLREAGKHLVIASPGYGVRRLLALTQQEDALSVFDSVSEALASG